MPRLYNGSDVRVQCVANAHVVVEHPDQRRAFSIGLAQEPSFLMRDAARCKAQGRWCAPMQRKRVGHVWYCTAQRIRIGGGSANVLWLQIGGPFAVICGCHMENGCEDEAFHRAGAARRQGSLVCTRQKRRASACKTLANALEATEISRLRAPAEL